MDGSLNPLNYFCLSVIDLIFQHISIKQLILLSETSTDFHQSISTSRKFIKNVQLKIDSSVCRRFHDKEFSVFVKSMKRNYKNIHFDGTDVISKMQLTTKYHRTELKSVKISNMIFNRPTLLENFIEFIRNSVEEFSMNSVFVFECDTKILISIPNLKNLEMVDCNDQENSFVKRVSFLVSCENLEKLTLNYSGVDVLNQRKLFCRNEKLRELSVSDLDESFFEGIEKIVKFRLKKFSIRFSSEERFRSKPNLENFLRSQMDTLQRLEISGWIRENTLKTIFMLPKLEVLKLSGAKKFFVRLQRDELTNGMTKNSSLLEIILTDDLVNYQELWHLLLKNAPNLNRFQLYNSSYFS